MSLYTLLRRFCIDAYLQLAAMRELPRPPYSSPIIARNDSITDRLSETESPKRLLSHLRNSDLAKKLNDIGHNWLWHQDVFEWWFLERVLQATDGSEFDQNAFARVYRRLQAELSRPTFRLRRLTALSGVPALKRSIVLSDTTCIAPIDFSWHRYEVANLLVWPYQDHTRAPVFGIDPDSRLLIQTRLVKKGNEGKGLLEARQQMDEETERVVTALKLALSTPIYAMKHYSAYLSSFPFLPIGHDESVDHEGFSFGVTRPATNKEIRELRLCYRFMCQDAHHQPPFFQTSLNRFATSYRFRQLEQSIVDLVVSLEGMYPTESDLKYRLAVYVASQLGSNDDARKELFEKVSASYDLRNAIVHGRREAEKDVAKALRRLFPNLKDGQPADINKHMWQAVRELQGIVRRSLRAYIYMRNNNPTACWPKSKLLEILPLDGRAQKETHQALGIGRW